MLSKKFKKIPRRWPSSALFRVRRQSEMELPEWEGYSFELARALIDDTSRDLANANTTPQQKMRAMKLMMGFRWTKKAIRAAGAAEISGLAQRAVRLNCARARQEIGGMVAQAPVRPPRAHGRATAQMMELDSPHRSRGPSLGGAVEKALRRT